MISDPSNIIARIAWCRLQQQLLSVTPEERAGWWTEEAGLVDALFDRDRTTFMRKEHQSQFARYERGLEDGHALLGFQQFNNRWQDTYGEVGPGPLTATTQVDRRPSQVPPPVHEGESQR
jgi:hypothetical protein